MKSKRLVCSLTLGLAVLLARPSLAQDSSSGMRCDVDGNDVKLSWNIQFFAPIRAFVVSRDGSPIATLEPEATGYKDENAPSGEHLYVLSAVSMAGDIGAVARCVVVVGDFGLKCRVTSPRHTFLEWGPILIDIAIDKFVIRRNGRVIAEVGPDQMEYSDRTAEPGVNRYMVHAVSAGNPFIIGACTVRHPTGFSCTVRPPQVAIDWSDVAIPEIAFRYFQIQRDGEAIARVEPNVFRYVDEPGAGEHHYQVIGITRGRDGDPLIDPVLIDPVPVDRVVAAGGGDEVGGVDIIDAPDFLIGECKIVMPGTIVPAPQNLTCVDLDAENDARLANVDILLGEHDVLLVWRIPQRTRYDKVLITRNGARIASIPGDQFYYVDRDLGPGVYNYSVHGVVNDQISPPAECEVQVPRIPVPPPRALTCEYLPNSDELSIDPDGRVVLEWRNTANYDFLVVVRNGEKHARVEGDVERFVDRDPPAGVVRYDVFGVIRFRSSSAVTCLVRVPVGEVKPPKNLVCVVVVPVPGDLLPIDPVDFPVDNANGAVIGVDPDRPIRATVFLRWENGDRYDRVVIVRNDSVIATLPGTANSHSDNPPFLHGKLVYEVYGVILNQRSRAARCEVDLGPPVVPPLRDLECTVDGQVLSPNDPAVGPDGPISIPVPVVKLTWVNPFRYARIGIWRDGEALATLPGDAMGYRDIHPGEGIHVYRLVGFDGEGNQSESVGCEVLVGDIVVPPIQDLACVAIRIATSDGAVASLRWQNPIDYDAIIVHRNGELLAELRGDATSFVDRDVEPGHYGYQLVGVVHGIRSAPAACRVIIPGPPPANILYFSSGLFVEDAATGDPIPDIANRPGRLNCMASNSDPIQGWSFGVCHDPAALTVADADLGSTAAALNEGDGPTFLALDRHDGGVTMAAVIDQMDPADTLPPDNNHRLLDLRYEAGPDGVDGKCYRVRYCNTLGDPPVAVLYVVKGFEVDPETRPGVVCIPEPIPRHQFVRGDSNGDRKVDMSDSVTILGWLFMGEKEPGCLEAADANGSGEVNIADPIYALAWEFSGGPPPPAPFPSCGSAELVIGCEEPPCPIPAGL